MKKHPLIIIMLIILSLSIVVAHGEETFEAAEEIIESHTSCDNLDEDEFEILGDFYMEQMHPGEIHEIMDERMGGEGSESLREAHIQLGQNIYCGDGEFGMMNSGMMGNMMNLTTNRTPIAWIFPLIFGILLGIGIILLVQDKKK